MQIKQITRIGVLVLFVLATICWVGIALSDEVDESARPTGGMMTIPIIILGYIATAIAAFIAIFYSVTTLLKSPNLKKTLLYFGIFIGLFLVGLALGSGTELVKDGEQVVSAFGSRMVSAGLFMFYVLALAAIGLMIYTSFWKLKK